MGGKRIVGLVREGVEFSQAVAAVHTAEHQGSFGGACCDRAVEEAYTIDEQVVDEALIAEVGVGRIMEMAAEEGMPF